MAEDTSDFIKNFRSMLNGAEIPDDVQNLLKNFMASNQNSTSSASNENSSNSLDPEKLQQLFSRMQSSQNTQNASQEKADSSFSFDMDTLLKMKQIMEKFQSQGDDPRSHLLLSLKPYLRESRKNKVDQYVQLLKFTNVLDILGPLGGEK